MSLTVEEAAEHLLEVGTDLTPDIADAVGILLRDAVDSGAELDRASSGSSVSLRWIVAGTWTSLLLVYTEKWQCIEVNGPRTGRGAEVTSAAERALARALPPYGGTPGQRPSYELAALELADSRVALREAFEEIGSAALSSMLGYKSELPRTPWRVEELSQLRMAAHADTVALIDQLATASPQRMTLNELGEPIGRSGRGVAALLGSLSGMVRARFHRENWPFQVEKTAAGWHYWMEKDQALLWSRSASDQLDVVPSSAYPTLTEVNEVLHVSGLWSSYGVVADVMGKPGAARALANANWNQGRGRIARQSGITESEDSEKEQAWRDSHPDEVAVHEAFGYVLDKPWPREWVASADEIRMMLSLQPSTAALRLRLEQRLRTIVAAAERVDDAAVWQVVDELRALIQRLS